ncbi:MAG: uroporphyrinogen-III C-methyltransferase [Chlorobiales bacterium]|nr:uroporphyrinogen-III C-methyltransferase [Chlorobiales bacterium]
MASNPDPVHVVIGHSKHPLSDRTLFSFPCVLMMLEGDPFQALLDGKVDALVIPAADLPYRLPARLEAAALITQTIIQDVDASHPLHDKSVIVVQHDRADLKVLFSLMDIRHTYGKVYLTGGGAGVRDYLTIRADALLRNADVIFYDDLIDTGLLDFYTAEKIFVGKRKGRHHADQDAINQQLYHAALKKQVVVRLKGGDPLIFGRGGEEMAYLMDRQIDVEIVAGVSAVQSAAASAGIPLTLRAVSGGVTLLSAHNALAGAADRTLVYYMCASRLKELQTTLIDEGIDPKMPVALVYKAGFIDESVTLISIDSMHLPEQVSPLLAIIGQTASLYRKRPKILFTGPAPCRCLLPGKIISMNSLKNSRKNFKDIDLFMFSGIAFTCPEEVEIISDIFGVVSSHLVLYAYGKYTAEKLWELGYNRTVLVL